MTAGPLRDDQGVEQALRKDLLRGLRQPGAILLVSLYELGHQPLQLASPAGFLRAAGFLPATLDLFAERFDEERVLSARAIFVSIPMHTALRLCIRLLSRVRALCPQTFIGCYGLYASLHADFLSRQGADAVLGGEYESTLVSLCEALEQGQAFVAGVTTTTQRALPVLDRLPFVAPFRDDLIPLSRYASYDPGDGSPLRTAGYVEASRGCLHLCRHCPIPPVYNGRFFIVPKEVVQADVRQQVASGAEHITFGDPDFLNGPRHAVAILRLLHGEFPDLTFDVTCKIEHILAHRALWPELALLGVRFVVSAVESLSPRVLSILDKGHTPADVEEALHLLRAAGIALRPSLVAFTPWTTLEDYLALLSFTAQYDLYDHIDPVQFTIRLLIPPRSYLLDTPELLPHLGALDEAALSYPWRHPDERMDRLHKQVTRRVEEAVAQKEEPRLTLLALAELARSMQTGQTGQTGQMSQTGRPIQVASTAWQASSNKAPRLTEPWFC